MLIAHAPLPSSQSNGAPAHVSPAAVEVHADQDDE
jgi:hypothetical protein